MGWTGMVDLYSLLLSSPNSNLAKIIEEVIGNKVELLYHLMASVGSGKLPQSKY